MEVYNQSVCGWVRDKQVWVTHDVCVITAKVSLPFESTLWATAVCPGNLLIILTF